MPGVLSLVLLGDPSSGAPTAYTQASTEGSCSSEPDHWARTQLPVTLFKPLFIK